MPPARWCRPPNTYWLRSRASAWTTLLSKSTGPKRRSWTEARPPSSRRSMRSASGCSIGRAVTSRCSSRCGWRKAMPTEKYGRIRAASAWKGRCRGLPPPTRRWSPYWHRPSPRTGPKPKSRKRFRLPYSGRNGGLFRSSGGGGAGQRLNPASGTGFIRFMALRSVAIEGVEGCARAATRVAAFLLVALALCACSMFDKDAVAPEEPADKLYNEGLYLLNTKKDAKNAAKKFEEVDRQHPYSEWARKALIMSAFAYYEANAYEDCISAARRYVTLHPGSPDAAYAQFLIGSSYFDQMPEISRDQERTEKAVQALEEVARKYPNSEYAVSANRKIEIARDQLAGKEMDIGRQLLNTRNYTGAINRFKVVVTRYQRTRHVEEALLRLTETYMALGIVEEAQTSAAVLGHNFPDSRWYKDAYALMQSRGLEPTENKGHRISQAFTKMASPQL